MADVTRAIEEIAPRLRDALAARGAALELHLEATAPAEDHLMGPLVTLLLAATRHADPPRVFSLRAHTRAGGDTEIIVDGLRFPPDFPDSEPDADLWRLASSFLVDHHRARLANSTERLLLLVPGQDRARDLRERRQSTN